MTLGSERVPVLESPFVLLREPRLFFRGGMGGCLQGGGRIAITGAELVRVTCSPVRG